MRHADHGDAQAAVQAADALGGVDCAEAGPHGRVGALCALVRGQHARLDDPDRVGEDGRGGAAEGAGDEVVGGSRALGAAGQGEEVLEAGFEEEEGGPAEGVAGKVRHEAAVERGEGVGAVCEGSQHGDGGEVVRGGAGGAGADWWQIVSIESLSSCKSSSIGQSTVCLVCLSVCLADMILLHQVVVGWWWGEAFQGDKARWSVDCLMAERPKEQERIKPGQDQENKTKTRQFLLCMRVLTMSSGCTTNVATVPALRPAIDSTMAGERRACSLPGM